METGTKVFVASIALSSAGLALYAAYCITESNKRLHVARVRHGKARDHHRAACLRIDLACDALSDIRSTLEGAMTSLVNERERPHGVD